MSKLFNPKDNVNYKNIINSSFLFSDQSFLNKHKDEYLLLHKNSETIPQFLDITLTKNSYSRFYLQNVSGLEQANSFISEVLIKNLPKKHKALTTQNFPIFVFDENAKFSVNHESFAKSRPDASPVPQFPFVLVSVKFYNALREHLLHNLNSLDLENVGDYNFLTDPQSIIDNPYSPLTLKSEGFDIFNLKTFNSCILQHIFSKNHDIDISNLFSDKKDIFYTKEGSSAYNNVPLSLSFPILRHEVFEIQTLDKNHISEENLTLLHNTNKEVLHKIFSNINRTDINKFFDITPLKKTKDLANVQQHIPYSFGLAYNIDLISEVLNERSMVKSKKSEIFAGSVLLPLVNDFDKNDLLNFLTKVSEKKIIEDETFLKYYISQLKTLFKIKHTTDRNSQISNFLDNLTNNELANLQKYFNENNPEISVLIQNNIDILGSSSDYKQKILENNTIFQSPFNMIGYSIHLNVTQLDNSMPLKLNFNKDALAPSRIRFTYEYVCSQIIRSLSAGFSLSIDVFTIQSNTDSILIANISYDSNTTDFVPSKKHMSEMILNIIEKMKTNENSQMTENLFVNHIKSLVHEEVLETKLHLESIKNKDNNNNNNSHKINRAKI